MADDSAVVSEFAAAPRRSSATKEWPEKSGFGTALGLPWYNRKTPNLFRAVRMIRQILMRSGSGGVVDPSAFSMEGASMAAGSGAGGSHIGSSSREPGPSGKSSVIIARALAVLIQVRFAGASEPTGLADIESSKLCRLVSDNSNDSSSLWPLNSSGSAARLTPLDDTQVSYNTQCKC